MAVPSSCGLIVAYEAIDTDRFFLSDEWGGCHVLTLRIDPATNTIAELVMCKLGVTSIASSVCYLANGFVYIGAEYGDSQLIKSFPAKPTPTMSSSRSLTRTVTLVPICDFCVVDGDNRGQSQVVTCSGAFKDGSLRVVRNGVGINMEARVDLPGVRLPGPCEKNSSTEHDAFLVQSFVTGETRILGFIDDEMGEVEFDGFETGYESNARTLLCANMTSDVMLK